jgi:hypothetical protein
MAHLTAKRSCRLGIACIALQYCLFPPDLQEQSRGYNAYLTRGGTPNARGRESAEDLRSGAHHDQNSEA